MKPFNTCLQLRSQLMSASCSNVITLQQLLYSYDIAATTHSQIVSIDAANMTQDINYKLLFNLRLCY